MLLLALAACGRDPLDTAWVADVAPWYCGTEALAARETADGGREARSRDMAMRLDRAVDGGLTGRYALQNAGEAYVGTLTAFAPTGPRAAVMSWENDHSQRGAARLSFSPDMKTLTVSWQVGAEVESGGSVLTASEPGACAAAALVP